MKISLALLILTILWPAHIAIRHSLCPALLPAAALSEKTSSQEEISEIQFHQLLDLFAQNYSDLIFEGSWANNTVNAQALRFSDIRLVVIYGGLARHPSMTLDSLTLMICHEVGHHKGGAPYFPNIHGNVSWASAEGAADYYSVQGCFNQIAQQLSSSPQQVANKDEMLLEQTCMAQNPQICPRALLAGLITAKLQWTVLPNNDPSPSLEKAETDIVQTTLLDYPSPQCRLDTFRASALLKERPACWYRSEEF